MNVLHISTECFPAAKVGGLGDVVGALPKYLKDLGASASVVMPKYQTTWLANQQFTQIFKGFVRIHKTYLPFTIEQEKGNSLGYPLFVVNLPEKFGRPGVYNDETGEGYSDNMERFLAFNLAVLHWLVNTPRLPEILHCHDHPTGLIPFLIKNSPEYKGLSKVPTILTIHNAAYHGAFGWQELYKLPWFDARARGILDWNNQINPLAIGIKTAWRFTTVSNSYLEEVKESGANGLEWLIHYEQHKALGILNGIDNEVWNPKTDEQIEFQLEDSIEEFKAKNRAHILQKFQLENDYPIITFIGRLAREKGADLLPDLIKNVFASGLKVNLIVLGTGDRTLMNRLGELHQRLVGKLGVALTYDEALAHQLYAGSDFLLMPSRVEPCGLNQMYAMRYGTIPIVRSIGGLKDTVPDIVESNGQGRGFRFSAFNLEEAYHAIYRALDLYYNQETQFSTLREKIMDIDFSWTKAAQEYLKLYNELISASSL